MEAQVRFDAAAGTLTVRQPGVRIGEAFSLELVEGQRVEPLPRITLGLSPGLRMRARPRSRA